MAGLRKAGRVALWALLGTTAGLCLVVALVLVLLATRPGGTFAADRVLGLLNGSLRGRLALGSAQVFPDGTFRIRGAAILGADGTPILSAEELSGRIELAALARREVRIHDVRLRGGVAELRQLDDGQLNVVTAVSPKIPSPPSATESATPGWRMAIDLAQLDVRHFAYLVLPGQTRLLDVVDVSARGRFELRPNGSLHIQSSIERARFNEPVALAIQADADLEITDEGAFSGEAKVRSATGDALVAEGRLTREGVSLNLATKELDLASLRSGLPRSRLTLEASVVGPLHSSDDLRLALTVSIHDSVLEGIPLSLSLRATAVSSGERKELLVDELVLREPGATLNTQGKIGPSSLDLASEIEVADAAKLSKALSQNPDLSLPPIAGRLTASFQITGTPTAPHVAARLTTPGLTIAGVRMGPADLSTRLAFAQSFERLTVQSLSLREPSGNWVLREPVDIALQPGIRISPFELDSDPQRIRAQVSATGQTISATAEVSLDLARLPLSPQLGLKGMAEAHVDFERHKGSETLQGKLSVTQASLHGLEIASVTAEVGLKDRYLSGALTAQTSAGTVYATVKAPARWPMDVTTNPLSATAQVHGLDLAQLHPLSAGLSGFDGTVDVSLTLLGSVGQPKLTLLATGREVGGPWIQSGEGSASTKSDRLDFTVSSSWEQTLTAHLDLSRAESSQMLLRITGALDLPAALALRGRHPRAPLGKLLVDAPLSLAIESAPLDLHETAGLLGIPSGLSGNASLNGQLKGSIGRPRGELKLQADGLAVSGHSLGKLGLEVFADDRELRASGALDSPQGSLALTARLAGPPEAWRHREAARASPLEAHVTLSSVPLWALLGAPESYRGTLTGTADLAGSLQAPRAAANLRLDGAQLEGKPLGTTSVDLTWEDSRLNASLAVEQPAGGKITAQVTLPLALGAQPQNQELRGSFLAQGFDLSPLTAATPSLHQVAGILDAQLDASGTLKSPLLTGALSINEGSLAIAGFGLFSDVVVAAHLSKDSYTLDRLSIRSGKGTANLSGTLTRAEKGYALQAQLDSQRFALYAADRLVAHLTSAVEVNGSLGDGRNQVDVLVQSMEIAIPSLAPKSLGAVSMDKDIVIASKNTTAVPAKPMPLMVHLSAPGPLTLTGPDLTLHAKADLWARLDPSFVLKGGINVTSGGLNLFGKKFVVNEASVEFGDPSKEIFGAPDNPLLSARASTDSNGTKVVARVYGRLPEPDITLTSDPAMSEDQIISLLLGGAPDNGQQSGAINPLTNVLVNQTLGSSVPVDSLSVSATHVEAGKQIGNQIYVSGAYNNDPDPRANQFEARLSYRLSKSWTVDGKYGTSGAGAVNVEWKTDW